MSIFKVQLNNVGQGLLDMDPRTASQNVLGTPFTVSLQRQCYVMGPKKINRLLKDGDTFTDCNYWKKFAYPNVPYDQAFISILSDDGSVYSDLPEENTFGVGASFTLSTSLADNKIDFLNSVKTSGGSDSSIAAGGPAKFLQVTNTHGSIALTGELNGDTNLTFTLAAGQSQIFNSGDLAVTLLRLKSASSNGTCFVIASVLSTPRS